MTDTTESLRVVLDRGARTLHDGTSWSAGPWCTWCNMFIGEHLDDCPYAALASALARLDKMGNLLADAGYTPLGDDYAATLRVVLERLEAAEREYHDLLWCVGTKHSGETRHETAKRYIVEAEIRGMGDGKPTLALKETPNDTSDARSGQKSPVGKNG